MSPAHIITIFMWWEHFFWDVNSKKFKIYYLFLLLFKCSCLHFPTTTFPCPTYPTSHPQSYPSLWLSPWVLYTCSLMILCLLSLVISLPPPLWLLSVCSTLFVIFKYIIPYCNYSHHAVYKIFIFMTRILYPLNKLSPCSHLLVDGNFQFVYLILWLT